MNLKNCSNFLVLGLILCVVGVAAAGILAWFDGVTKPTIEAAKIRKTNQALAQVLPEFDNTPSQNVCEVDGVKFYGAFKDDVLVALAAEAVSGSGYAGEVAGLVGLSPAGKVLMLKGERSAVLITRQNETPGLGTNVCNRQQLKTLDTVFGAEKVDESILPANVVLDSFGGLGTDDTPLRITKDGGKVTFITGATISSRAVTELVNKVLNSFRNNRREIVRTLTEQEIVKND